jgi:TonB family protein
MRLLVQSYSSSAGIGPSAVFSVAAHAMLLVGALYGGGSRTDSLDEEDVSAHIFFLPPPDRVPGREAMEEHLQYVEVGGGEKITGPESELGKHVGQPALDESRDGGRKHGNEPVEQQQQAAVQSSDSVYSILNVDEGAVRVEGSAAPAYPADMLAAAVEGTVVARYVIDTTGRADPASFQVLSTTHGSFTQAVMEALPGMRFSSAAVQGRKVRQLVEQSFQFHIAPPLSAPAEHTRAGRTP